MREAVKTVLPIAILGIRLRRLDVRERPNCFTPLQGRLCRMSRQQLSECHARPSNNRNEGASWSQNRGRRTGPLRRKPAAVLALFFSRKRLLSIRTLYRGFSCRCPLPQSGMKWLFRQNPCARTTAWQRPVPRRPSRLAQRASQSSVTPPWEINQRTFLKCACPNFY